MLFRRCRRKLAVKVGGRRRKRRLKMLRTALRLRAEAYGNQAFCDESMLAGNYETSRHFRSLAMGLWGRSQETVQAARPLAETRVERARRLFIRRSKAGNGVAFKGVRP